MADFVAPAINAEEASEWELGAGASLDGTSQVISGGATWRGAAETTNPDWAAIHGDEAAYRAGLCRRWVAEVAVKPRSVTGDAPLLGQRASGRGWDVRVDGGGRVRVTFATDAGVQTVALGSAEEPAAVPGAWTAMTVVYEPGGVDPPLPPPPGGDRSEYEAERAEVERRVRTYGVDGVGWLFLIVTENARTRYTYEECFGVFAPAENGEKMVLGRDAGDGAKLDGELAFASARNEELVEWPDHEAFVAFYSDAAQRRLDFLRAKGA